MLDVGHWTLELKTLCLCAFAPLCLNKDLINFFTTKPNFNYASFKF